MTQPDTSRIIGELYQKAIAEGRDFDAVVREHFEAMARDQDALAKVR